MFLAVITGIIPYLIVEWVDVMAIWKRVVCGAVDGYRWHGCRASSEVHVTMSSTVLYLSTHDAR